MLSKEVFKLTFYLHKVRHIKSLVHPHYHCPILKVEGITAKGEQQ